MTSVHGAGPGHVRWAMLGVISLGILALTLNWFDVATAFPLIGAQFKVGLGPLSYLISLYIVGYGLTHIPGGMLATALGMKKTLVLGLGVQGLAGIMSGLSDSYTELAFFRVVSGVGGSVFIAVGTAAVVVWFRGKRRHARARHHRRRRLQRGGRHRALRLALRAARDKLAYVTDPGRRLRAARHAGDPDGLPGPGRRSVARRRQVRSRRTARRAREQRSMGLRCRAASADMAPTSPPRSYSAST